MAALTGDEPISAGNLRAALSGVGGVSVLYASESAYGSSTVNLGESLLGYSAVAIGVRSAEYSDTTAASVILCKAQIEQFLGNTRGIYGDIMQSNGNTSFSLTFPSETTVSCNNSTYITTIIGYK